MQDCSEPQANPERLSDCGSQSESKVQQTGYSWTWLQRRAERIRARKVKRVELYEDILMKELMALSEDSGAAIIADIQVRLKSATELQSEYKTLEAYLNELKGDEDEERRRLESKLHTQREQMKQVIQLMRILNPDMVTPEDDPPKVQAPAEEASSETCAHPEECVWKLKYLQARLQLELTTHKSLDNQIALYHDMLNNFPIHVRDTIIVMLSELLAMVIDNDNQQQENTLLAKKLQELGKENSLKAAEVQQNHVMFAGITRALQAAIQPRAARMDTAHGHGPDRHPDPGAGDTVDPDADRDVGPGRGP